MPSTKNIVFTYRELAEALVRQGDINEGLWGIYLEFGLQGTNINSPSGELIPSAILGVLKVGLQRFEKPNNLTVDAAEINADTNKK